MRSPNLESYEALREYSIVFEGGQTNMFIVDATEYVTENGHGPNQRSAYPRFD